MKNQPMEDNPDNAEKALAEALIAGKLGSLYVNMVMADIGLSDSDIDRLTHVKIEKNAREVMDAFNRHDHPGPLYAISAMVEQVASALFMTAFYANILGPEDKRIKALEEHLGGAMKAIEALRPKTKKEKKPHADNTRSS